MEEKNQAVLDMESQAEQHARKKPGRRAAVFIAAAVALAAAALLVFGVAGGHLGGTEPTIITSSVLKEIINVSDFSTYTAVYNGVAKVTEDDDPEEVRYYVSYEARVDAGFDFSKIGMDVDEENMSVRLKLPEIKITNVNVDIASLDFIFVDKRANASAVTSEAYAACEKDAKAESSAQGAIIELARQNAENVLTALIEPLLGQTETQQYAVVIE